MRYFLCALIFLTGNAFGEDVATCIRLTSRKATSATEAEEDLALLKKQLMTIYADQMTKTKPKPGFVSTIKSMFGAAELPLKINEMNLWVEKDFDQSGKEYFGNQYNELVAFGALRISPREFVDNINSWNLDFGQRARVSYVFEEPLRYGSEKVHDGREIATFRLIFGKAEVYQHPKYVIGHSHGVQADPIMDSIVHVIRSKGQVPFIIEVLHTHPRRQRIVVGIDTEGKFIMRYKISPLSGADIEIAQDLKRLYPQALVRMIAVASDEISYQIEL